MRSENFPCSRVEETSARRVASSCAASHVAHDACGEFGEFGEFGEGGEGGEVQAPVDGTPEGVDAERLDRRPHLERPRTPGCPRVGGAGRGDDGERAVSAREVELDRSAQCLRLDPHGGVGGDHVHLVRAEAEDPCCPADRRVGLVPAVDPGQAVHRAQPKLAGGRERGEVRRRAPGHQHAVGALGHADPATEPAQDRELDL